jgi:hypothetical protein
VKRKETFLEGEYSIHHRIPGMHRKDAIIGNEQGGDVYRRHLGWERRERLTNVKRRIYERP